MTATIDPVADAFSPKTITINGATIRFGGIDERGNATAKARLNWTEIARYARKPNTNLLLIVYTLPDGTQKQLSFGTSLVLVDGMTIQVT